MFSKGFFFRAIDVCLGFYTVLTVFHLFNSDSSQIHVSWTIFNQYLTSPSFWHWQASCSAINFHNPERKVGKRLLPV